jgi:hypothetical protein
MNRSWQNSLRNINLKETFESWGLGGFYEFMRSQIIMNNMRFMCICAFLFIMVFMGFYLDSTPIKIIATILLLFMIFFRFTILF